MFFWIRFLRRYRVTTGAEGMIGEAAQVIGPGRVRLRGEIWSAARRGAGRAGAGGRRGWADAGGRTRRRRVAASDLLRGTMTLPPGPSAPPAVQTARWLWRPIDFLDACRRRHGDAFSVKFLGFTTPMVIVSDPESIRALYTSRENGLPPGRSFALEPIMGPRSVLLLEGADHLSRRKAMLPPFHGERMRAYEGADRRCRARRDRALAAGGAVRDPPADAGVDAGGDPPRGLRGHRPGRRERLRALLGGLLDKLASPRLQLRMVARPPPRAHGTPGRDSRRR